MQRLRDLSLTPGSRLCLHVPGIRNAATVGLQLCMIFEDRAIPLRVASMPKRQSWLGRKLCPISPVKWLATKTLVSTSDAQAKIDSLPIPVPTRFDCMAQNPRRFLAFVAALHDQPAVLIYETGGMDPSGAKSLHGYAKQHYSGVLIHRCTGDSHNCLLQPDCINIDM